MDRDSRHCTGDSDKDHPQEKETPKSKMEEVLQIGVKRRSEKQRSKGKI